MHLNLTQHSKESPVEEATCKSVCYENGMVEELRTLSLKSSIFAS